MNTFPFFPLPEPGETVYSLFSRCVARSGLPHSYLLQEFIGRTNATTMVSAFPGYLSSLSAKMPTGHPWRNAILIAREHTTLPYYTYFDETADREKWYRKLSEAASSFPLRLTLGLNRYGRHLPAHPRFCPECAFEDVESFGFSLFRREHQLPGVALCWKHGTPLFMGCAHCGPYPIKGKPLTMAGRCLCERMTPLPAHPDLPETTEPLLWFARQSTFMLHSPGSNYTSIRATLRERVLEQGLAHGSQIDLKRLALAIEDRFGRQFLEWLGTPVWKGETPASWVCQFLPPQVNVQRRSPILLFLLIIGTLYDSVETFEKTIEHSTPPAQKSEEEPLPQPNWSGELFRLLQTGGEYDLPGISRCLGIPTDQLIKEIRLRSWRVPLSPQIRNNWGDQKIAAIRKDLLQGMKKTRIMHDHSCNTRLLTLIELDEPGLHDVHRTAAERKLQEKYRGQLREYLLDNPTAKRIDIVNDLQNAYHYLIKRDNDWFLEQIPKTKTTAWTPRKDKVDWPLLDRKKAVEISGVFDEMLRVGSKPIHATATAALKRVGLMEQYHRNPGKFPRVTEIFQNRSEKRSQFVRRRLAWAVEQMAAAGTPISRKMLFRVAALTPRVVKDYWDEVIDLAGQLNAEIHERSLFL